MQLTLARSDVHQVITDDQRLLYHIPTGNLFEQDALVSEIIELFDNNSQQAETAVHEKLQNRHSYDDIAETLSELKSLRVILVNDSEQVQPTHISAQQLNTLILNVNTGCNLSCTYCYKEDLARPVDGEKMPFTVARDAIELLLRESPQQHQYTLTFFGGEPLTNMPLIKQVVTYAEQRFADLGKAIHFSLTTNATLLGDAVNEYLNQHKFGITISMDGPKAYHDKNRITVGGEGTYDVVASKAVRLIKNYTARPIGARVTLTHGITDIVSIWDHLVNKIGFHEVGFAPVTSGELSSYNLTRDELGSIFNNMESLGELYLQAALNNRYIGFSNLHRLLIDLHQGTRKHLPCGAGTALLSVDTRGGINLCHRFAGSDLPLFGHVEEGINSDSLAEFLQQRLDRSDTECKTCRVRNICSGGCYHESYARYGDPIKPTYHYCDLLRHWIDFGMQLYARIMRDNPTFFDVHLQPGRYLI